METLEGEKLAASLDCHFWETSATTMRNVEDCLSDVVSEVRRQQRFTVASAENEKSSFVKKLKHVFHGTREKEAAS